MNDETKRLALQELKSLSIRELVRGMAAFSHPPRMRFKPVSDYGDTYGCFMCEVLNGDEARFLEKREISMSTAYECYNEWFHSECIRELVERAAV